MGSWRSAITGRPSISVAMATYNGERYLPEMLESLAAQTRRPDELVVRDDGSQDRTVGILKAFARRVPFRVEVLAGGPRLGFAQNFIAASRACTGRVIFFADQDDTWRPHKLARVTQGLWPRRPLALFHDFAVELDDGTTLAPSVYDLLAERGFSPNSAVNGCSMAVTQAFVKLWGWPSVESGVSHDAWVAILSTAFGQRRNLADVLVDWRVHDTNFSGWIPREDSWQFVSPSHEATEADVLVDLLIKRRKARSWTRTFLDVLRQRGDRVDPAVSRELARTLKANRRRHRRAPR
jgi:glycosyltransferase involved in cell wall biosynthesis